MLLTGFSRSTFPTFDQVPGLIKKLPRRLVEGLKENFSQIFNQLICNQFLKPVKTAWAKNVKLLEGDFFYFLLF